MLFAVDRAMTADLKQRSEERLENSASGVAAGLQAFTGQRFAALAALKAHSEASKEINKEEFLEFAARLSKDIPEVRSFQWADKNWVVTFVYPLKGNEAAVGHDLKTAPQAAPHVAKAIREKRMTVNDPYELKQGGLGLIARAPIFRDGEFAGLNIAVLDVPHIIENAFRDDALEGYHARLRDSHGKVFWTSSTKSEFGAGALTRKIRLADNYWVLELKPKASQLLPMSALRVGLWAIGLFGILSLSLWARASRSQADALEKGIEERTSRLRSINAITTALSNSNEDTGILEQALQEVLSQLKLDSGAVLSADRRERSLGLIAHSNCTPELIEALGGATSDKGPIGRALSTGEVQIVEDPRQLISSDEIGGADGKSASVFIWPLRSRDHSVGAMILINNTKRSLSGDDIELLETLSKQWGLALENMRFMKYQRNIIKSLQQSLLPEKAPVIDGIDVGSVYESATPQADVGGDFYDIFTLSDSRLALVMGDVSGKGVEAATTTALIRYSVRILAQEAISPQQLMARLNHMVWEHKVRQGGFVTVFLGFLDTSTGILDHCSAGHPSPGLLRQNGSFAYCQGEHGFPLGVVREANYVSHEITVGVDDTLIMFTDGVIEARTSGELYGEERLMHAARQAPRSAQAIAEAIYRDCSKFAGNRLADDLAIVALRRLS